MADNSKDTGTGGINIDGNVHTMDTGVPDSQVDNKKKYSSGDISVDNTVKDISTPTRETFAKYLSKATLGQVGSSTHKNVYPVGNGDTTTVTLVSLKDTTGAPVSPGPQNNEAKFNSGFHSAIASNNPVGIKRGLKAGSESASPDGNTLLPDASSAADPGGNYIKFVTTTPATGLKNPIKTYTGNLVLPNLFDFNSTLVSIPEYEGVGAPSGLRSFTKTTTFADDAGTSTNILGGGRTLTLEDAAKTISDKTKDNFFPVDEPIVSELLNVVKLDSSAVLAATGNSKFFKNINIGSYLGVNSKGNLKNQDGNGVFPDGNKLLPEASSAAPSGGDYIKFVTTTDATGLQERIKKYTTDVVDLNLFDFDNTLVSLSDGTLGQVPGGIRNIKIMPAASTPVTDGGTSKNILGVDSTGDYTLTADETRTLAGLETQNNRFPVDNPAVEVTLRDESGNPISVTDAQENPFASSFFTKEVQKVNDVDKIFPKLRSSYTDALTDAASAVSNKFIIKRGKTEKTDGVDGNQLLSTIASETNKVATLTDQAKTYTDAVVEPNLRDYSDYTSDKKTANLSGDAQLENLYDLYAPTDLATDGGESKNILDPTKNITFSSLADTISTVTKNNFFPVDSPVVDGKLKDADVASSAKLKPTENSKFFTNINIGSNFEVNSKGNIVEGPANNKLQDGNKLLLDATVPANSGGKYIKFAKAFKNQKLLVYTDSQLSKNIYIPSDSNVGVKGNIYNLKPENFFGPDALYKPVSGPEDSGTFDNIQKDPSKREITKEISFQRAVSEVKGKNSPGGVGNLYKPAVVLPEKLFSFTTEKGYPLSSTALQNTVVSLEQYVFPPGFTNKKSNSPELPSSYTKIGDSLNIKRGKSIRPGPDGNTLLKDAAERLSNADQEIASTTLVENSVVNKYVSEVLKANRFSSSEKFANRYFEVNSPSDLRGIATDENYLLKSSFSKPSDLRKGSSSRPAASYSFNRLAQIGTLLQLRAAGELFTKGDGINPTSEGAGFSAILPGAGQTVALPGESNTLKTKNLEVKSIIETLTSEEIDEDSLIKLNDTYNGTINHAFEKFSSFSALGMTALAIALAIAVFVAFGAVSAIGSIFEQGGFITDRVFTGSGSQSNRPGLGSFNGFFPKSGMNALDMILSAFSPLPGPTTNQKTGYILFGFRPTYSTYVTAVVNGTMSLFGIGTGKKSTGFGDAQTKFAAITALSSPGQTVVVLRSMVRAALELVNMFVDLGKSANPFSFIEGLVEILPKIRESKMIAMMNTLATLGDSNTASAITLAEGATDDKLKAANIQDMYDQTLDHDAGKKVSFIDSTDPKDGRTRYARSRIDPTGLTTTRLAWASNQAPTSMLVSINLAKFQSLGRTGIVPNGLNEASIKGGLHRTTVYSGGNRISTADRENLEGILDGEHVPFYFHDVRTNEILGFHAFLTSLTDDYTASYDSVDAYGRVESIKIYKNTSRKISVSFVVAALDEEDFDTMWMKINKLTTMVYPQYTKGRTIQLDEANSFVRPFTQQIGASPLIRLRIGDLISSNYSKFNLAGIFGLASDAAAVQGRNFEGSDPAKRKQEAAQEKLGVLKEEAEARKLRAEELKSKLNQPDSAKFLPEFGYSFQLPAGVKYSYTETDPKSKKQSVKMAQFPAGLDACSAKIKRSDEGNYYVKISPDRALKAALEAKPAVVAADGSAKAKPVTSTPSKPKDVNGPLVNAVTGLEVKIAKADFEKFILTPASQVDFDGAAEKAKQKVEKAAADAVTINNRISAEGKDALSPNEQQAINSAALPSAAAETAYVKEVDTFLSPTDNAVARSFRSSGGKGIAGFIDSLSYDWNSSTWETKYSGMKAPKMCRVTISFSPIHDLSPGLDSDGYNRAPVYPVGMFSGRRVD